MNFCPHTHRAHTLALQLLMFVTPSLFRNCTYHTNAHARTTPEACNSTAAWGCLPTCVPPLLSAIRLAIRLCRTKVQILLDTARQTVQLHGGVRSHRELFTRGHQIARTGANGSAVGGGPRGNSGAGKVRASATNAATASTTSSGRGAALFMEQRVEKVCQNALAAGGARVELAVDLGRMKWDENQTLVGIYKL